MENSLKSLCRKLECVSLKAMSGAHRSAVRSLTTSVFDQVLLGMEGRTCGDGKRKLARTPRRPEPSREASPHHFFSLLRASQKQNMMESSTVGTSEEQG